jgi:hypothetical protein
MVFFVTKLRKTKMESDGDTDSYVTDLTDDMIEEEEEDWSVLDNQFYSQEIIEFVVDALRNQNQNHSDSQKLYLEKLIETLSKKLVFLLQKRPVFEYHGALDGYLKVLLDTVLSGEQVVKIKEVSLIDARISTFEEIDSLARFLKRNPIQTLKLSGTCFQSVLLFDHLISQLYECKIEMLQLGVPFSTTLNSICGLLLNNTSLIDLDINHVSFFDDEVEEMEKFATVLEKNQSLEKLTFFDCRMTHEVLVHVSRIIKKNKYLKYLDLGSLSAPSSGLEMIFEAFQENSTIEYLFLDRFRQKNHINLFLKCLKNNKSLVRHKDHRKFDDTFVINHEIRTFLMNNELNHASRECAAQEFLIVSRKLLLLSELPMELKMNTLQIILGSQFFIDERIFINAFFSLDSIGKINFTKSFSARSLIIQAHIRSGLS